MKRKLKLETELTNWLITQLEEELDATENRIIANNLDLVASFNIESYNIDAGLVNIITVAVSYLRITYLKSFKLK